MHLKIQRELWDRNRSLWPKKANPSPVSARFRPARTALERIVMTAAVWLPDCLRQQGELPMSAAAITNQGLKVIAFLVAMLWASIVAEHLIVRKPTGKSPGP